MAHVLRAPGVPGIALANLKQQRLQVFVLSDKDGQPLRRVPVYAEAALVTRNPHYARQDLLNPELSGLQALELEVHFALIRETNEDSFKKLITEISERVQVYSVSRMVDLAPWRTFTSEVLEAISKDDLLTSQTSVAKDSALAAIVDRAATSTGMPAGSPLVSVASLPLGCLSTDHVGFASFDLTRLDPSNIFPHENDSGSITVDSSKSPGRPALSLPSLQKPSLLDWQTSPGSFAAVPSSLVGTDGCESFTPANFAVQTFPLRQLHRLIGRSGITPVDAEFPPALVVEYEVSITPVGYSLGDISYTLPLVSGESVRLAIVDWRHDASVKRDEDTTFTEGLVHDQARDRTISETVKAALDEWQRGGSIMGGASAATGGAVSSGAYGASAGGAASLGGAYTTSSRSRDLSADTMQKLADSVKQASSATRELISTVVVQTDEKESESIQTRYFSNNNRGHTMTVSYYEMLRHHVLKISFKKADEAVLVQRSKFSWIASLTGASSWDLTNDVLLLAKQYLLKPALLDTALTPAFDSLAKLLKERRRLGLNPAPLWDGEKTFVRFKINFSVADTSPNMLRCRILTTGAVDPVLLWVDGNDAVAGDDMNTNAAGNRFNQDNTSFTLTSADLATPVRWKDMTQFYFIITGDDNLIVQLGNVTGIFSSDSGGGTIDLLPSPGKRPEWYHSGDRQDVYLPTRPPPPPSRGPEAETAVGIDDYAATRLLKDPLVAEKDYYSRVLDFAVPYYSYASEFDAIVAAGGSRLLDFASPKPLEMLGNYVAFPRLPSDITTANASVIDSLYAGLVDESHERLISFPVLGLFAEAKIGHCNVAEEIDDTRFWRWDEHPLPVMASDIAAVQPVQPQSNPPQATPTAFPTPIVQIQQPLAEPDPQGMSAVLKAITTPDIFRNMSGIAQVQAMLHDLTEAAVSMAQAASANLNNAQKNSTQASGNQLTHDENMAKIANDVARQSSNQTIPDQAQYAINAAKNQAAAGTITSQQRDQIVANQLGNMKGSTAPPPTLTPAPPAPTADPLRPRPLLLTVRNALNAVVWGRYMVDVTQAAVINGKLARVNTKPAENEAEEWRDSYQSLPYNPVIDRPLFYLTLRGDIKSFAAADDTMYVGAQNLSFEIAADVWANFDVASVVLTLATEEYTTKSKSTDDIAKKLVISGKLNGTVSGGIGLAGLAEKDVTGTGGGEISVDWTPTDEKKEYSEEKEMTVTYYTGGIGITEVK
ncbi:hypothetical protein B0A48_07085 [Cryoendolithus antarcticus]|uniref:Uncharacterized protein n=1 Tax=Cryoendolithus antarcticus TaxID=1507870 RepID=A0A1V8T835_9PEZI|nr:hypothetical protein B0A48_07085 [Cryoendolithus antarcticus]